MNISKARALLGSSLHRIPRFLNLIVSSVVHWDTRPLALLRAILSRVSPQDQERIERRRAYLEASSDLIGDITVANTIRERVTVGQQTKNASMPVDKCLLLYRLVMYYKPVVVLELGTAVGISGSYIGAALKDLGGGKLHTIEALPQCVEIARSTFEAFQLDEIVEVSEGYFEKLIPVIGPRIAPIELVVIDGHKSGHYMQVYFEMLEPFLSTRSIVLFDDVAWSDDMKEGWQQLREHVRACYSHTWGNLGILDCEGRHGRRF